MNQEFENIIIPELLNVVSGFHRPENWMKLEHSHWSEN
jgi:hypothetical protein